MTFKGAALGMMAAGLSLFGYTTWLSKKSYMVEWSATVNKSTPKSTPSTSTWTSEPVASSQIPATRVNNMEQAFIDAVNKRTEPIPPVPDLLHLKGEAPPSASFTPLQAAEGGGEVLGGARSRAAPSTRAREWSGTVCFHERSLRIKDHSALAARVLEEVRKTNPEIAAVDPNDITLSVINVNVL